MVADYLLAKDKMAILAAWRFVKLPIRRDCCSRRWWARIYGWSRWRAFARDLEPDHPTLMRDGNPSLLVAPGRKPRIRRYRDRHDAQRPAFVKTLRVRDFDYDYGRITVHAGKGAFTLPGPLDSPPG